MTQPSADLAALESRLRAAEDRLALLDLEGEYAFAYDSRQGDAWAALFLPDGVYQGRRLEGMPPQNLVRGREALTRFCDEQPTSGMHFMQVPHLVLDGDAATGRVHFEYRASAVDERGRSSSRVATGYYDVAYVRTPEGWRIRRRVTTYLSLATSTTYPYEARPADLAAPLPVSDDVGAYHDSR